MEYKQIMYSNLIIFDLQVEDRFEGHHWRPIRRSGGQMLHFNSSGSILLDVLHHIFLYSFSGTPSVMWSLVGFTSCSSGFPHPQKQTDWTRSTFSNLIFNYSWLLLPKPDSSCLSLSLFPVWVGSPVLLQTVFPKQGGALSRSALCLYWAGIWLTSESPNDFVSNNMENWASAFQPTILIILLPSGQKEWKSSKSRSGVDAWKSVS